MESRDNQPTYPTSSDNSSYGRHIGPPYFQWETHISAYYNSHNDIVGVQDN